MVGNGFQFFMFKDNIMAITGVSNYMEEFL
jgi:hypothetical protein